MERILASCFPKLAAKARLKFDKVREKHLLLLPEKVVVLNETAASILILCDGSQTVKLITERMRDSLQNDNETTEISELPDLQTMEEDISEFLQEMAYQGWVVIHSHAENK
ncbi:MAG: pyrroloquinoline quinone biosynthesis peptide chaperone PqqD [Heyndrickxia sp.]